MTAHTEKIITDCMDLLAGIDPESRAEISTKIFLEYCIYQDQSENNKRLAAARESSGHGRRWNQ